MRYSCVVIDDEPGSREVLEKHIARHPNLFLKMSFEESPKALNYLKEHSVDIIFVDIEMPAITGVQLMERLGPEGYNFIFVTAHPQFALKAFDLGAIHYLQKPAFYNQFSNAVDRAIKQLQTSKQETIVLKEGRTKIQIPIKDIDWVISENYYIRIYRSRFIDKELLIRMPLYKLAELLPQDRFFRINQSIIVSLNYIEKLRNREVILRNGKKIQISQKYKEVKTLIETRLKM